MTDLMTRALLVCIFAFPFLACDSQGGEEADTEASDGAFEDQDPLLQCSNLPPPAASDLVLEAFAEEVEGLGTSVMFILRMEDALKDQPFPEKVVPCRTEDGSLRYLASVASGQPFAYFDLACSPGHKAVLVRAPRGATWDPEGLHLTLPTEGAEEEITLFEIVPLP